MGKTDMERIGLFSEMEYITIGDKYVSPFNRKYIFLFSSAIQEHGLTSLYCKKGLAAFDKFSMLDEHRVKMEWLG